MKRLNNLVTELLNLEKIPSGTEARFVNPREGWVFIDSAGSGKVRLGLDDAGAVIDQVGAGTGEAMRFLPAGEHRVRAEGAVERLIVRAAPELIFCKYQYDPHVRPHGPYDWAFLERHVLDHVNCVVGNGSDGQRPMAEAWKRQGKRWLVECPLPGLRQEESITADDAYEFWTRNPGLQDPLLDGLIVDEFLAGKRGSDPKYLVRLEGAERVAEKNFQHVMHNCYSHHLGSFNAQHWAWMNYHFEVFRAKGERARLTISDWADGTSPGGPVGQELMFNFVEAQPYLED